MARHSHWAKIRRNKGAADAKRGALFSKLSRQIMIAVKEKGADPSANFKLRLALGDARRVNMPKDNVERAILCGSGTAEGAEMRELRYEAIAPGGIALIIEAVTDNRSRTSGNIKALLSKYGASLAETGAVAWQFDRKGVIVIAGSGAAKQSREDKDSLVLELIASGAEDIKEEDGALTIYTAPGDLHKVLDTASGLGVDIEYSGLDWIPKTTVSPPEDARGQLEKLYSVLDDDEEISSYATNQG